MLNVCLLVDNVCMAILCIMYTENINTESTDLLWGHFVYRAVLTGTNPC